MKPSLNILSTHHAYGYSAQLNSQRPLCGAALQLETSIVLFYLLDNPPLLVLLKFQGIKETP